MCIDLLTNPTVVGAIIGAIVGAIASAIFGIVISRYKFDKRKKGAKALIKSEINYIIDALEEFKEKYLEEEIKDLDNNMQDLINFYYIMSNFPILTNRNWINLISFIPSIFKEGEIDKINQFYVECEKLTDFAKSLEDEEPIDILTYFNNDEKSETKTLTPLKTINSHRNMFRNDINELIEFGGEIKQIFH